MQLGLNEAECLSCVMFVLIQQMDTAYTGQPVIIDGQQQQLPGGPVGNYYSLSVCLSAEQTYMQYAGNKMNEEST